MLHSTYEHNPKSILLFFLLFFGLFSTPSLALDNFTTTQTINYRLDQQGNATVNHQIQIKNNLSSVFIREYQLTIPQKNLSQLSATDQSGNILTETRLANDSTILYLKFKQPQVGKDALTNFVINYSIPLLATPKGKTWEIYLPQPPPSQETTINLDLPTSFGQLSFASLKPSFQSTIGNFTHYSFQIKDINQKIGLSFGQSQLFDLKLTYFLANPTSQTIIKEIPIPPDTPSQTLIYQQFDPPPFNITSDADGNWLAQYQLTPQQKISIILSGQAKIISPLPTPLTINPADYLKSTTFWPTTNPLIIDTSQTLTNAKSIYNYVVSNLEYDYSRLNQSQRRGGLTALSQPSQSLCTDFTDLFITLSRAKGIPAREIQGFAYSNNPKIKPINTTADILHAWPQYYDFQKKSWQSVDPTWEKTTNGIDFFHDLDLNHLAFVIHGLSDQYPPPPGSFRDDNNQKTVEVTFATKDYEINYLPLSLKILKTSLDQTLVEIRNPNLFAIKQVNLSLPDSNWTTNYPLLLPLSATLLSLPSSPLINKLTLSVVDNYHSVYQISAPNQNYYLYLSLLIGCLILILCTCGIIITSHR